MSTAATIKATHFIAVDYRDGTWTATSGHQVATSRVSALDSAETVAATLCGHDDFLLLFDHTDRHFRCYDYGELGGQP